MCTSVRLIRRVGLRAFGLAMLIAAPLLHIFVMNPLRSFRNVYQLGLMSGMVAMRTMTNTVTDAVGASRTRR